MRDAIADRRWTHGLDRPRTLVHPGPVQPRRITSLCAPRGRHVRLAVLPGMSLLDGLVQSLAALGITSAAINILGGEFERIDYCVAPPDPTGRAAVAYSAPIHAGRGYLLAANATLGENEDGSPLLHCHGALRGEDGLVRGGHILPHASIVGRRPLIALVVALEGFAVRVGRDPETTLPLFQPMALRGRETRAEAA